MSIDYAGIIYGLMQSEPNITAAVVVGTGKQVAYQTDNWDVSGEVGTLINAWSGGNAQSITLQGVRYSVFQMTPERFVAKNIKDGYTLLGSKTPDGEYLVTFMGPDGSMMSAPHDVARAADQMKTGGSYMDPNAQLGTYDTQPAGVGATGGVDPNLKADIEGFVAWIKQADGLATYIDYYLNQNNTDIINRLAKVYNDFRQIFNF